MSYNVRAPVEKPPLGLTPRKFWLETRLGKILGAIDRYYTTGKEVPLEWYRELVVISLELGKDK